MRGMEIVLLVLFVLPIWRAGSTGILAAGQRSGPVPPAGLGRNFNMEDLR